MNPDVYGVGAAAVGFGLPCLLAVCRTLHRRPTSQSRGELSPGPVVTRFRACPNCRRTQACSVHRDGSFTCLTCMTTERARTNR
ncbi:hypothetical protein [Streptacidiphilus rugosus]|uniref:hypothetical protein n=1 Tax=Streptacidiphilus rugosus TaxID=405783 RepID=UPI000561457C|nr:hypothetical protein [Streptacidiphilus rugosus]